MPRRDAIDPTLVLWVLALNALLSIPLALRTRQLRQDWQAWNTAATANRVLATRAMAGGRRNTGSPP